MCIEKYVQHFFAPIPTLWSAPGELDTLDAAVLRRLRYIAACPVGVAAWFVAAFAMGGPSATRAGTLLGSVVQAAVMLGARAHRRVACHCLGAHDACLLPAPAARPASRSLAGATQLAHFFTLFLMFTLSALPVMTWTTSTRCDMLHTKMYARVGADPCTLLMWDLFFASLLPAGTVRGSAFAALGSLVMTDVPAPALSMLGRSRRCSRRVGSSCRFCSAWRVAVVKATTMPRRSWRAKRGRRQAGRALVGPQASWRRRGRR